MLLCLLKNTTVENSYLIYNIYAWWGGYELWHFSPQPKCVNFDCPFSLAENFIVTQLGPLWSHLQVTKVTFASLEVPDQPADPPHILLFIKLAEQCFSLTQPANFSQVSDQRTGPKSFSQTPLYVKSLGMWCFPGADEEAFKLPDAPPSPWPMEKRYVVISLSLLHSHEPISEFGVLLKE